MWLHSAAISGSTAEQDGAKPTPLSYRDRLFVPAKEHVPKREQNPALGLERHVDGLERNARLRCGRCHRRRRVTVPLEQPLRSVKDLPPSCRCLAPIGGVWSERRA